MSTRLPSGQTSSARPDTRLLMVRYGVIGAGAMGREHIENLKHIPETSVTALADPFPESLERAKSLIDGEVKTFSDHRALLESNLVDAVIIATPNYTHVDVLKDALATSLHVFIEKPLCTTIEDCLNVITWSKNRTGLVWMGLEYRYMPPVAELIKIVHSGGVGDVQQVTIREHREPFYPKVGDWNRFREKTGGTLVEKCCHYFNLMDHITQETPVRVFASGGQRVNFLDEVYDGKRADMLDSAYVIVEYASGKRAMLDLCMFAENTVDKEYISVTGDAGKIESFLPSLEIRHGKRAAVGNFKEWTYSAGKTKDLDIRKVWDDSIEYLGFHYGASYLEHKKLHKAIVEGGKPEVTLEEGLRSVATGLAAHKSIDESRPVMMSEVLPVGWN
ncbi:MAG: Gfo/Idh/MocA family protein [Candidatus Nanopelagicaceae bacterium]